MPKNVEAKIRVTCLDALAAKAQSIGAEERGFINQVDTYFHSAARLKLRELEDRSELIAYTRPDLAALRTSNYIVARVEDPDALKCVLIAALGVVGVVRKRRRLLTLGRTRIHLDDVEGLGEFLELEVVLDDGEDESVGQREADEILRALGLDTEPKVPGSYVDLRLTVP